MDRPRGFEDHRFLGDKRTQRAYDLDSDPDPGVIEELVSSEQATRFAPDTEAEVRNRGYRLVRAG